MAIDEYKTALVTGASAGIGRAAVHALCSAGLSVIAAARRADRLKTLADETGATPLVLDLCDTDALYDALAPLEVDVLVNNAGLGRGMASFVDAERGDIDLTIDTNVTAFLHTLRAVLPGMRKRKRGHVVGIGSVAGLYPLQSPIYGGSKGAVRLASQNLRLDLAGTGIRVTEICPGRVVTEFVAGAAGEEAARKTYGSFDELQPEDIAEAILYAVSAPWRVNVSTIEIVPTEQAFGGLRFTRVER
ncbi:MAG: SDR family oxidoreductase [Rhodospirillales bacterium]|nr:SDR family oxidoreductase [Rhodospirillales bacterium]